LKRGTPREEKSDVLLMEYSYGTQKGVQEILRGKSGEKDKMIHYGNAWKDLKKKEREETFTKLKGSRQGGGALWGKKPGT